VLDHGHSTKTVYLPTVHPFFLTISLSLSPHRRRPHAPLAVPSPSHARRRPLARSRPSPSPHAATTLDAPRRPSSSLARPPLAIPRLAAPCRPMPGRAPTPHARTRPACHARAPRHCPSLSPSPRPRPPACRPPRRARAPSPLKYVWLSAIVLILLFAGFINLPVQGRCYRNFLLLGLC
jgi:hypothetical protein